MVNNDLYKMVNSLMDSDVDSAKKFLSSYLDTKAVGILNQTTNNQDYVMNQPETKTEK